MKSRPLRESDIPHLRAMAEASGFPYPDLTNPHMEAVHVVVDDQDRPIMAVAAERIVQLYLYAGDLSPVAKLHALRLLHDSLAADLKAKGYGEVNAFLPPSIASKFGRRLARSFGWAQNWPSWFRKL